MKTVKLKLVRRYIIDQVDEMKYLGVIIIVLMGGWIKK